MENTTSTPSSSKLHPGFFFLSLGVLASLITSVTAFLNLVFEALDKKFPDVLNSVYQYGYASYSYDAMRGALATVIIAFPILVTVSYFWKKYIKNGLGTIDTVIRKWMIYLVLFLSSIVVMIDLITLVRYFVSGEITTRFILKVLTVLVVACLVGIYYIFEIRAEGMRSRAGLLFALVGSALTLGVIIWSFSVMGSPATQRALRLDERRVEDLQSIQWQVISYWQQKEKLPSQISDIASPLSGYTLPVDPEFEKGTQYEYKATDKLSFELCATFSRPMPAGWQENSVGIRPMMETAPAMSEGVAGSMYYPYNGTNDSWDHEAGHTCFVRTIDTDIYPPFKK